MVLPRDPGFGRQFLPAVTLVPGHRDSTVRSDASLETLPFCSVLGRNFPWASPQLFILRIDLYAEPLFSTGSSLLTAQNRTRLLASDRLADRHECLCRTVGGEARDAFPDCDRIYHRRNRFFLARV